MPLKISQLIDATVPLTGAELLPIVQSAKTRHASLTQLLTLTDFTQSGPGAVPRPQQEKSREIISVTDYMTAAQKADVAARTHALDVSDAWQKAATAGGGREVWVPLGTHKLTTTITFPTDTQLCGESRDEAIAYRDASHTGHTFVFGQDVPGLHAGAISIRNLWMFRDIKFNPGATAYNPGVSTSIVSPLGAAQAHVYINETARGLIDNCTFSNMPYNLVLSGGSNIRLTNNDFGGSIFDNFTPALQEGQAQIWFKRAGTVAPTLVYSNNNYFGGGYASAPRNVTIGSSTFSMVENVGAAFGLQIDACEGLTSEGDYYGGHNTHSVYVHPVAGAASSNLKWIACFFDGARMDSMNFSHAEALGASTMVSVIGCGFNGESNCQRAITLEGSLSAASTFGVTIAENVIMGHLETPIFIWGGVGVKLTGNVIAAYNNRGGNAGNVTITAGVLVNGGGVGAGFADQVYASGNLYGGGLNNWSPVNNCQYGIFFNGTFTGASADNEKSAGLGLAGGALVTGGDSSVHTVGAAGQPAFENAWVNSAGGSNSAGFWKDGNGVAHLQGSVKTGTIGLTAFTLPAGFRPPLNCLFSTTSNGLFGSLTVNNAGQVIPAAGSNVSFSLENISFRTTA